MYPKLKIDLKKIEHNTKIAAEACAEYGIDIMGVTKVFCAHEAAAEAMVRGGVKYLADSRVSNLEKLKHLNVEKVLLRIPMPSEVAGVVNYADISLNSELKTIDALNDAAQRANRKHKIILMTDLGDLREGILPENLMAAVDHIMGLDHIILHGLGVNLTCYGGVIPSEENLGQLVALAAKIEEAYKITLKVISGGNSSSYFLVEKNQLPGKINNLRLGELLVLGRETAYGELVEGMYDDCFTLEAEIVELKNKRSVPIGEIGMDAFGNKPSFTDIGMIDRGILAVGKQDVNADAIFPTDEGIEILGCSSDHMLLNMTQANETYEVGDIITCKLEYGSILSLSTSHYVTKETI